MGKKKAPPPPDYAAIAREQAAAQQKLAAQQTVENRPDQITPYGRVSWSQDPSGRWTQQTTFNPEMQSAFDQQMNLQRQRSNLAGSFMNRVQSDFAQPFNFGGMPARQEMSGFQRLDTGLQDYSPQMSTSVAQRGVTRGFDIQGPQMSIDPMTGQIQSTFAQRAGPQMSIDPMTGEVVRGIQNTNLNSNFASRSGEIARNIQNTNLDENFDEMTGGLARNVQQENIQRALNFSDNPAMPVFDASYRDRVASDLMQRMSPVHQQQRDELETNLANRGFAVGSAAYTRALEDLNKRQASERYNALDMAGGEAQRLFNMGMGARQQAFQEDVTGGQFANTAAQQAFNQGLTANQFQNAATQQAYQQALGARQAANQARSQQFGQNLQAGSFQNAATQQAFQQDLGAQQAANQALAQQFGQNLQAGNFQNAATQQAFNQALNAGQFGNQAQQQLFGQDLSRTQLANQAAQQAYQQSLGAAQFGNQAQNQLFGQRMGLADLANRASSQEFNQDLAAQQFRNQALGQMSGMDINRMNAINAARAQQQGLEQSFAGFQNQLRQQAIQEEALRRNMSLNEMNALLSGQQVSMPTFGGFSQAQMGQAPNLMGAAQNTYDAQVQAVNAANARSGGLMGGLFGLGAAALGGPAGSLGSQLFNFGRR